MKRFLLGLFALLAAPTVALAQPPAANPADEAFRGRCRGHFYYTAAVSDDDDNRRMAWLERAIKTDPKLARAYYNRGVLYIRRGEPAKARADFEKAVELEPDYVNAHYNLACVLGLEARHDDALSALDKALKAGYQKFDKIAADPDLKGLKDKPALAALIARYQAANDPEKLSLLKKMQVLPAEERAQALGNAVTQSDPDALNGALWLAQEGPYELRTLAMFFLRKLDRPESKSALVVGLYDANGYVNKAAANALVEYGKDVEKLVVPVLDDNDTGAPFFAMQVLAKIGAVDAAEKIIPYLRDDQPFTRLTAADSLANLGIIAAIPDVEAALRNLPKDAEQHEFYKTRLGFSLGRLQQIKNSGGRKPGNP